MPLTSAQRVRYRIQDYPKVANLNLYGDGMATRFDLPDRNIVSGSAYVAAVNAWQPTGATFNGSGFVEFSGVISANSAIRVTYVYTVFGDELIDDTISAYGGINEVSREFVHMLLMDASKRSRWMSPDGAQYDDQGSITALGVLLSALNNEIDQDTIAYGGIIGWAETQGDY